MTGTEYQELAMRTCSIPYNDKEAMLNHALLGLTSEAGETAGILQKTYQGHPDPIRSEAERTHLIKELGDCLWMTAEALEAIGATVDEAMEMNIQKLRERYPEGFQAEKSLHRSPDDI